MTDHGRWRTWIVASYARAGRGPLCAVQDLDTLDAAVLCHDTAADPVFVYANRTAEALWEHALVGTPSRLTAPPEERATRADALASPGVVTGYSGIRESATGRRFLIQDAIIWPVYDDRGDLRGQAAAFARWEPLPLTPAAED